MRKLAVVSIFGLVSPLAASLICSVIFFLFSSIVNDSFIGSVADVAMLPVALVIGFFIPLLTTGCGLGIVPSSIIGATLSARDRSLRWTLASGALSYAAIALAMAAFGGWSRFGYFDSSRSRAAWEQRWDSLTFWGRAAETGKDIALLALAGAGASALCWFLTRGLRRRAQGADLSCDQGPALATSGAVSAPVAAGRWTRKLGVMMIFSVASPLAAAVIYATLFFAASTYTHPEPIAGPGGIARGLLIVLMFAFIFLTTTACAYGFIPFTLIGASLNWRDRSLAWTIAAGAISYAFITLAVAGFAWRDGYGLPAGARSREVWADRWGGMALPDEPGAALWQVVMITAAGGGAAALSWRATRRLRRRPDA